MIKMIQDFWNGFDASGHLSLILIMIFVPIAIVGIILRTKGRSTIKKYKRLSADVGRTSVDIGRKMLNEQGLNNIMFERAAGKLTDYYDPESYIIKLSETVYSSSSISAISIACHEAGHAVKHEEEKDFAVMRVKLIPYVAVANRAVFPLLLVGIILGFFGFVTSILPMIGLIFLFLGFLAFGASMLYAFISLPLELDASKRALHYLKTHKVLKAKELELCRKTLKACTMTHFSEFFFSVVEFPRYLIWLLFMPKDL